MGDMIGYMGRAKDIEKAREECREAAGRAEEAAGKANTASKTADAAAKRADAAAGEISVKLQEVDGAVENAKNAENKADTAAGKADTAAKKADTAAAEAKRAADAVNIKADLLDIFLAGYLAEEPAAEITEGCYWCMPYGVSGHATIIKNGEEAEGGSTCCAKLEVSPGEIYRVTTNRDGSYYIGTKNAVVVATAELAAGGYELISNEYGPTKEGGNEYILAVPEGADHLLVNTFSNNPKDIKIQKIKSTKASGIVLLWSGLLKSRGGEGIHFSIPESCFFNGRKELVLMFNGYCPTETRGMYDMCIAGMCFGTAEDFGLGEGVGGPMYKGEFARYAYREEACVIGQTTHNMQIEAFVKKVTDNRYATCSVINRSDCFYLTSVSAMIPG